MNQVVENEYAYLIQRAEKEGNTIRVKALKIGLERLRKREAEKNSEEVLENA